MFFSITGLMIFTFSLGAFATDETWICTIGMTWKFETDFLNALDDLYCTITAIFKIKDPFYLLSKSVSKHMWGIAGYPESDNYTRLSHYQDCMSIPECMMYTAWKYTRTLVPGEIDCDVDIFNNFERFAIVLAKGPNCKGKNIINAEEVKRYNVCAKEKNLPTITLDTILDKPAKPARG